MSDRTRRILVGTLAAVFVVGVLMLQFVDVTSMGCTTTGTHVTNAAGVAIRSTTATTCTWWSMALPAVLLFGFIGAVLATISWSQRRRRRGEEASSSMGEGRRRDRPLATLSSSAISPTGPVEAAVLGRV